MRTTADEKLSEAKVKLKEAYKLILEVSDPDTHGHDQYREDFIEDLLLAAISIREIQKKL